MIKIKKKVSTVALEKDIKKLKGIDASIKKMVKDHVQGEHKKARIKHYAGLAMMGFISAEANRPKGMDFQSITKASFEMGKAMVIYEQEHDPEFERILSSKVKDD